MLDADRDAQLAHRLLQIAARNPVGKYGERLMCAGRRRRCVGPVAVPALLAADVLVDVETARALTRSAPPAPSTGERRRLEGRWMRRGGACVDARDHLSGLAAQAQLGRTNPATQCFVNSLCHRRMHSDAVALLDLDQYVERRRRLAFEHRLLRSATARLLVREGDGLDATHQVVERRVDQEVVEIRAVRGAHQLHAALRDGARRGSLELRADLVDHDALRHVILDGLDHHRVLEHRGAHLHATGAADSRVRYVAVAGDLVRRVDDDHALAAFVRKDAGALTQHSCLPDTRRAEQQDRLPADHDVFDDVDGSRDRASHTAGQPDHLARAIAYRADAVQGPFDARPVVVAEVTDALDHVFDVRVPDV